MSDLKDFQSKVFREYKSLTSRFADADLFAEKGAIALIKDQNHGVVKRNILKILIISRMKFQNFYFKSKFFVEIERVAEEIIKNPKIRKMLCDSFKRKISADFFKEELEIEVIITLTANLTKQKLEEFLIKQNDEFLIKSDKLLFSMMTYKILQKGIENYCLESA